MPARMLLLVLIAAALPLAAAENLSEPLGQSSAAKSAGTSSTDATGTWQTWTGEDPELSAVIRATIDEVIAKQRNVGLAAAVWQHGRVVFAAGHGYADVEHRVPVTRDTRFQIASVTKAFTGLTLLKLWEVGRVDLDAPIQRYVPSFPQKPGAPITLRLLQAHLGGIRGYRPNERTPDFFARHFTRASDAISIFANDPLAAPPGSQPVYSSYGYNLIAAGIEGALRIPFSEVVATEVIRPLGLSQTSTPDARVPIPHRSRSYTYHPPGEPGVETDTLFRGRDWDYSYNAGGGNILSTAEDLVRFGSVFLAPGFLKPETRKLLLNPLRRDAIQSFGLVVTADAEQRPVLFGTGEIEAFQSGLTIWPEHDLVVAITSNTDGIGARSAELRRDLPRRIGLLILDRASRSASAPEPLARSQQHTMRGRWDVAISELEPAIQRAQKSKDVRSEAALTAEFGRVLAERNFFFRRDPQKALATFERAAALAEQAQDKKTLADAIHGQGRIHYSERLAGTGDWETSRALFERAYQLRQETGDKRGLAESYFFLGLVHQMKKEYEPAMELFQKSRALTLDLGDRVQQSFAERHIGYIHEVRKELDQAEKFYVSSLKLREETGLEVGVPFALALLADFRAKHRGDADGAVELLQRAIAAAEKCNSVRGKFLAEMALGRAYLEKKDSANARLYTERALAGAEAFGHQEAVDEARQQLAEIAAVKPQGN